MLEICNESDNNAQPLLCGEGYGVYTNTGEMTYRFTVPGMMGPVGWGRNVSCRSGLEGKLPDGRVFLWDAFHVDVVRLTQSVHLTFVEGASPLWVFMAARLEETMGACTQIPGPFILLSVTFPPLYSVPYTLKDAVFGRLHEHVPGVKLAELLPIMLSSISPSS